MSHYNVAGFCHGLSEIDDLLAPFNEDVEPESPYAEFVEDEGGDLDEQTGKRGYWHNPNARYDWYCLGGRWRGMLRLLYGRVGICASLDKVDKGYRYEPNTCDAARVADCDFSRDEEAYKRALRRWEVFVEGTKQTEDEKAKGWIQLYKPEFYISRYGTKDFYAEFESSFVPYGFVSADGEWHSCARMGWFGCDDGTVDGLKAYQAEFGDYLKQAASENLMICIMDFHI